MQMFPSLKFDYLLSLYFLMPKLLIHISAYALHLWLRRRFGTHSKQKEEDEVLLATAAVHACKDVATAAASVVKLAHSLRYGYYYYSSLEVSATAHTVFRSVLLAEPSA